MHLTEVERLAQEALMPNYARLELAQGLCDGVATTTRQRLRQVTEHALVAGSHRIDDNGVSGMGSTAAAQNLVALSRR